ncbi:hypothetical protein ACFPFW_08500 [Flaviflagellibacter deserti]|uniref:DUF3606 domain-containing protein n=2 Tax=Flaviflagellibacter deserti TaxID=2267266 RepID=A0ABV9Z1N1_9HYPH
MGVNQTPGKAQNVVVSKRFNVLDLAEETGIPVAKARKLIKQFGNDAETLIAVVQGNLNIASLKRE